MPWRVEPLGIKVQPRLSRTIELCRQSAPNLIPPPLHLVGVETCAQFALLLSQIDDPRLSSYPHVIVTADADTADALADDIAFFDPVKSPKVLTGFDVSPYSLLYPSPKATSNRLHWLHRAADAAPNDIFIAPVSALLQKTLPFAAFQKNRIVLERGGMVTENLFRRLDEMGYSPAPTVEDPGTYSNRGGIVDIYSPAQPNPIRIELFGDVIESLREYDPVSQLSVGDRLKVYIVPAREILFTDETRQNAARRLAQSAEGRAVDRSDLQEKIRALSQGQYFPGAEFLLADFYGGTEFPLGYFSTPVHFWMFDRLAVMREADKLHAELANEFSATDNHVIQPAISDLYCRFDELIPPDSSDRIYVDKIDVVDEAEESKTEPERWPGYSLAEFTAQAHALQHSAADQQAFVARKFKEWRDAGYRIFLASHSRGMAERMSLYVERLNMKPAVVGDESYEWTRFIDEQNDSASVIHIFPRRLSSGARIPDEQIILLRDEDLWGRRSVVRHASRDKKEDDRGQALTFGDLKPGDLVVHVIHGIGQYDGLKTITVEGAPAEYIELKYKDNDRLFLPVYRVGQLQKYTGPANPALIDKLGGTGWQKTKTKVRHHLRDVAAKLLNLYARRKAIARPAYSPPGDEYFQFENSFPYEETEDQLRAIGDVMSDLQRPNPMDRLICGDVGFGKTEVALRAAFKVIMDRRQVAIVAPTTILTAQHYNTFQKRFQEWPVTIRVLNRFVSTKDVRKTLAELAEGKVDIVIGTHRLLSKDVSFKDLGLLIVDEEQKFGVVHKEKLRHMRESVDTLVMSATPIPRTLNMSLVGARDLSLINTPPENRLPTRTFVCKFDAETIRKGIEGELARGGQVFFLHNRVQSIDACAAQLRQIVPNARLAVAHGQMDEGQLEQTMLKFFNHEVDVLLCTAIIESGMDIPRANTIFIDNANQFGVSQLYQLRGRVGRSQERAYCYLLIPNNKAVDRQALERLKVIQENTALGSGIRIAQYDLELRGAGDILGEDQSGHIHAVGYELYLELLDEVLRETRGEPPKEETLEPEINLRIPALIPDKYVPDIRMRLYYYKALSQIRDAQDLDRIEDEFRDQFGAPPEPVLNLMGLMLIRKMCRDLGVRDVSAGKQMLSLAFTPKTPLPADEIVRLTARANKKYQLTPDQRLKIRMNEITWTRVLGELEDLLKLCPAPVKNATAAP